MAPRGQNSSSRVRAGAPSSLGTGATWRSPPRRTGGRASSLSRKQRARAVLRTVTHSTPRHAERDALCRLRRHGRDRGDVRRDVHQHRSQGEHRGQPVLHVSGGDVWCDERVRRLWRCAAVRRHRDTPPVPRQRAGCPLSMLSVDTKGLNTRPEQPRRAVHRDAFCGRRCMWGMSLLVCIVRQQLVVRGVCGGDVAVFGRCVLRPSARDCPDTRRRRWV